MIYSKMLLYILLLLCSCGSIEKLSSQDKIDLPSCEYEIVLKGINMGVQPSEEFNFRFSPEKETDTIEVSKYYLQWKILMRSCDGACTIQAFDKTGNLKITGNYTKSIGLFKEYQISFDASTLSDYVEVGYYYRPLQEGDWIFYGEDGEVLKKNSFRLIFENDIERGLPEE